MPVGLIALSMATGFMCDEEKWSLASPPFRVRAILSLGKRARAHVNRHRRRYFNGQKRVYAAGQTPVSCSLEFASWLGLVIVTSDDRRTAANVVRPLIYDTLNFKMPPRCRASSLNHYFMVTPEPPTLSGSAR
jgi:hypothetical protein